MNPFKWLFNMIKSDLETVAHIYKSLSKGTPMFDPEKKAEFIAEIKAITPGSIIKDSWMWIMCILFMGACVWLLSAKYYELQCNSFVYYNYILPEIQKRSSNVSQFLWNITNFTG